MCSVTLSCHLLLPASHLCPLLGQPRHGTQTTSLSSFAGVKTGCTEHHFIFYQAFSPTVKTEILYFSISLPYNLISLRQTNKQKTPQKYYNELFIPCLYLLNLQHLNVSCKAINKVKLQVEIIHLAAEKR